MTPIEILNEIYRLPIAEQKALREKLLSNSESDRQQITQDEFDRVLFEEGFLANLPDETDEDDDFEPVEFTGKPISETIIEERR
jgi:hypothetical protein